MAQIETLSDGLAVLVKDPPSPAGFGVGKGVGERKIRHKRLHKSMLQCGM